MMKILLTAVNAKYIHSNLAIYSLRAYAEAYMEKCVKAGQGMQNIEIELAEYTINQQIDEILMDIYKRKPDILCFSCYIWNIEYVESLVKEIGKLREDLPVWLGGPEVSYDAVDVLNRLEPVRGVMKGEGEETFAQLCKIYSRACDGKYTGGNGVRYGEARSREDGRFGAMELDGELAGVEGITYRDSNGEIKDNPWRQAIDLSKIPFVYNWPGNQGEPCVAGLPGAGRCMQDFQNRIVYYESSRGCPFSCSYCLSSVDRQLRFRDLETVKKELQFFIDQRVPQVKFVDRTFNLRHEHAAAIWRYIAEHDRGITNFHFEVAADLLNEEELMILEGMRPGLVQLEIGVQSTNPDTIRAIRRTMDFGRVRAAAERIGKQGNIHQHLDLIAGLPFEDIRSFAISFDDVYRLRPEQLQLGFLKVLKGSSMEEQKQAYGLVYQSRPPYEVLFTRWISYEDMIRLKGVEEMVEVYYNSGQFRHTLDALAARFPSAFQMYDRLSRFYEEHGYEKVKHKRSEKYEILLRFIEETAGTERKMREKCFEEERPQDGGAGESPAAEEHQENAGTEEGRAAAGRPEGNAGEEGKETAYFRELLTYDYYLRENAGIRPDFAGEYKVSKETLRAFYENEEKRRRYLPAYEGYDRNQLRKMTHLEYFSQSGKYILFDYKERNVPGRDARTCEVTPDLAVIHTVAE
ncbi:MAG: DUF4080 domain-containing protein [Lachnospiraceae bacterium]